MIRDIQLTPQVPRRCKLVYEALSGLHGHTDYSQRTGRWRYIDLIMITGRSSSERKLRELVETCPGLVSQATVDGRAGRYKTFWLTSPRSTASADGMLFDLPMLGRPE